MTRIQFAPGAQTLRGTPGSAEALVSITETPLGGTPNSVASTPADANITTTTITGTTNNFRIDVASSTIGGDASFAFVNLAPGVASVDAVGNVSRVSNGVADIEVVAPPSVRRVQRNIATGETGVVTSWNSWVTGSLAKHVEDAIVAMIGVKTPGAATQAVLSSTSGGASSPNHIRNAGIFTGALDLTAISVHGTAYGSNIYPVVLISPRHVMAGHAGAKPENQWVFKDSAGNYQVRTVTSQVKIATDFGDNYVGLLDSQITTITPMKVLPANWASYLPTTRAAQAITQVLPVLNKGYTAGDWIRVLNWEHTLPEYATPQMYVRQCVSAPFAAWSSAVVGGDSNGPVFIPVNGAPALVHCMNFSWGGSVYPSNATAIQAAMDTLLPGQTLGAVSLAGFTAY